MTLVCWIWARLSEKLGTLALTFGLHFHMNVLSSDVKHFLFGKFHKYTRNMIIRKSNEISLVNHWTGFIFKFSRICNYRMLAISERIHENDLWELRKSG